MMQRIAFTKASGAGNDFVILNAFECNIPADRAALARALCDRHFGVGADGILILDRSTRADFAMEYYNADGSYGGMCGNGGRCIAQYAFLHGLTGPDSRFETLDYMYDAHMSGETVRLHMKDASAVHLDLHLNIYPDSYTVHFVDTGSPHIVIFSDQLDTLDVKTVGRRLRGHAQFAPAGTNVNFVSVTGPDAIKLRTYERGVEDETLACGTGSVAGAVIACLTQGVTPPVRVQVRSGEMLIVHLKQTAEGARDVHLEGSVTMIFTGNLVYDAASARIVSLDESNAETRT